MKNLISHLEKTVLSLCPKTLGIRARTLKNSLNKQHISRILEIYDIPIPDTAHDGHVELSAVEDLLSKASGWLSFHEATEALSVSQYSSSELERLGIAAAFLNRSKWVLDLQAHDPDLFESSAALKLSLLTPDCLESFSRDNVLEGVGTFEWSPLVYACCSCFGREIPELRMRRLAIVEELLKLGAAPNSGMYENESLRGYRTVLGGTIGCARSSELAELLLDAGADINDGPTLYEGSAIWEAVRCEDEASLALLLKFEPPLWHLCHALPHALALHNPAMVRRLLEHNADVDWNKTASSFGGTSIHEAVVLGSDVEILRSLLDAGGSTTTKDNAGRTAYQLAVCLNREEHASLLATHHPDGFESTEFEQWLNACFCGDARDASKKLKGVGERFEKSVHDHLWLAEAVRQDRARCAESLLKGGLDPNTVDYRGDTALHVAVRRGDVAMVKLLVDAGADANIPNFDGEFVLDVALNSNRQLSITVLETILERCEHCTRSEVKLRVDERDRFERAVDTISSGDIDTLKSLLNENPKFAQARSPRPHKCTLLNYVGVNGFEGERQVTPPNIVDIINVLLEAGADPNATCYTYRGGPGENVVGLASSSGAPNDAGLLLPMIHALVRGGARVDESWQILVDIHEAKLNHRLDQYFNELDVEPESCHRAYITFASQGDFDMVTRFIECGIDVNWSDASKVTALHQAALSGNRELVDLLLSHGADPFLRDAHFDGTVIGWADSGGHADLTRYLVERMKAMSSREN